MTMHSAITQAVDNSIILRIEEIEGRVPTDAEIANYLLAGLYGNGIGEYRWKGQVIVRTQPVVNGLEMDFHIQVCRPGPPPEEVSP